MSALMSKCCWQTQIWEEKLLLMGHNDLPGFSLSHITLQHAHVYSHPPLLFDVFVNGNELSMYKMTSSIQKKKDYPFFNFRGQSQLKWALTIGHLIQKLISRKLQADEMKIKS